MSNVIFIVTVLFCAAGLVGVGFVLGSHNWRQADALLHREMDEIKPLFPQRESYQRIEWNALVLMENCPDCQREQEQAL